MQRRVVVVGLCYGADESDACTIIVKWKVRDHNHIRCMLLEDVVSRRGYRRRLGTILTE